MQASLITTLVGLINMNPVRDNQTINFMFTIESKKTGIYRSVLKHTGVLFEHTLSLTG